MIFGGNPFWVSAWTSLFNVFSVFIVYELTKSLFKSKKAGLISAFLVSVSYYFIQYAGWLSNPSPTLTTVPLFFLGIWKYSEKKNWGLVLSMFALGLSIQFELFFIYLIPVLFLVCFVLKLGFPNLKTLLLSIGSFSLVTSTMILTEFKFHFSGVLAILGAGQKVGGDSNLLENIPKYADRFLETFSQTIYPTNLVVGKSLGIIVICLFIYLAFRNKKKTQALKTYLFVLIYLLSSCIMLVLGYHGAPWFLIGLAPAITVCVGFLLSKIKYSFLLFSILLLIFISNFSAILQSSDGGQVLLGPDKAALISTQLAAIDYTYNQSLGEKFVISTVTNPLYINAVWSYHYDWYGKKYGYLPSWGGGDQLYPYNTLQKQNGEEKYLYLIIDQTPRIGEQYRLDARNWASKKGSQKVDTKEFEGILVEKYILH